jgi:hypothetical protein
MLRFFLLVTVVFAAALVCACAGTDSQKKSANSSPQEAANPNGELHFKVPEGWTTEKPSSSMRVAQYKLPRTEGDNEDASLAIYYFGPGQGGSVADNIERWIGQVRQADGSSSKDKAKTETVNVNGLKVTTLEVTGLYSSEMAPAAGGHPADSTYRLRAAIVETPKGNYFAKLVGPVKTVTRWDQSFNDYVSSFEFK